MPGDRRDLILVIQQGRSVELESDLRSLNFYPPGVMITKILTV